MCTYVHTYTRTHIHTYTCKYARPSENGMDIIRVNDQATMMAGAAAASTHTNTCCMMCSFRQYNFQFIYPILLGSVTNEVECANCVYSATYVAFWAIIYVNSPGVSRYNSFSTRWNAVTLCTTLRLRRHRRRRRRRRCCCFWDLEKLEQMGILI